MTNADLRFGAATHVGRVREHNEDTYAVVEPRRLALLADGMGGHERGDVASRMAVDAVREALERPAPRSPWWIRWLRPIPDDLTRLVRAFEGANRAVHRADDRGDVFSMGTTLVGAWFREPDLLLANVGDSRAYRQRGDTLVQLSSDHSLLNDYLSAGLLRPEQVADFPFRNIINRGIGLRPTVVVDRWRLAVQPDDRYLLCSDGLTDLVDDATIASRLTGADFDPQAAADALIELALDAGGVDNVTAIIAYVPAEDA